MEIEIDLSNIYQCEEDLSRAIQREVTEYFVSNISDVVKKKVDEKVSQIIDAALSEVIEEKLPLFPETLLTEPYTIIARYEQKEITTNLREELLKALQEYMIYNKKAYEKNYFIKSIDYVIHSEVNQLKEYNTIADREFVAHVTVSVLADLKKKFNI